MIKEEIKRNEAKSEALNEVIFMALEKELSKNKILELLKDRALGFENIVKLLKAKK